ncbi:MAG: helix-turn-helix domain-containing protein [Hungatella hathewayi]|nr:helix-turn-helix domain-containing protein [Hungatella hathewayi]
MIFFLTFKQINQRIEELYEKKKCEPALTEVLLSLYHQGRYVEHASNQGLICYLGNSEIDTFQKQTEGLYIEWDSLQLEYMARHPDLNRGSDEICELSDRRADVFLNFLFSKTEQRIHHHASFFEINYVFSGSYHFTFEGKEYMLYPGDLCIISPNARHKIKEEADNSFLIQQYMNNDSFHSTFISLLASDNILSNFFKDILTNRNQQNFLILSAGSSESFDYIQKIAKDIYLEQFKYDNYAPDCNICLLKILFSNMLRVHHKSYQFYSGNMDIDFVPILSYLEKNYRTTSLSEAAEVFHYSTSFLSSYIKQITGKTYTEMIRNLKMNDAIEHLVHSNKSIEEISFLVGYKTVDHFSRAFKQQFHMAPSLYRKEHQNKKYFS